MYDRARTVAWSVGLAVALALVALVSATIGPVSIPAGTVAKAVLNEVALPTLSGAGVGWIRPFRFTVESSDAVIVTELRLPRIALGAAVGFALATAGTVMQGFFRNPMADPSIIGVSTGAAVGAVAAIVFRPAIPLVPNLQAMAFGVALLAGFAVYLIAREGGRTPVATLLLAGVAVQTFLGAVVSYTLLFAGDSLERAVYWLMGHLHAANWGKVGAVWPVAVLGFAVTFAYARDLNVLLVGEDDAQTLGVEVERTKQILLVVAAVLTAAAVAVAGVIGFVGLVVPHVMRLLVGPDHRVLLPTSALAGAGFLVATDTLARAGPAEVPVGIVTAALGAPFFLYLLRSREVHSL
ncbi:iron ABC transporter [Haloglomus irregulare]|jgi:iron complex transport system permease protein|uniref:Cobalamin import system permease protein BtuC n=1 Tax=Haloglomus irregulare TaxID=2234134 RepID=A0A554NCW2_9EURY|nr:vitamin B12 ABC transporter permease BtuC [Haloglomus irregulare]TSD15213.1 iron ABC transporter [Haloglomus irregulare]